MNIQDAMSAVKARPGNPFAWLDLGNAFAATGDTAKARECYEKALSLDPTLSEAAAALRALNGTGTPPRVVPAPIAVPTPKRSRTPVWFALSALGFLVAVLALTTGGAIFWAASSPDALLNENPALQRFGAMVCKARSGTYIEATDDLLSRWTDAYRLAANTSRIALSPLVQRMQDMRSEAARQDVPRCVQAIHDKLLDSMDATIDAYLIFMGDGDESETSDKFKESGTALGAFLAGYNLINPGAGKQVLEDLGVD